MGVGEEQVDAVVEALFHFGFETVVVGRAGVVAVGGDVEEARIGLEELGVGDGFAADGTGDGELSIVRVGGGGQQRRALRKLGGGELVEVGVGNADVDDVRADVGNVDR